MLTADELSARGREASTAGRHALAVSLLTFLIASLLPLFGGSYGLGQAFPMSNPGCRAASHLSTAWPDQNSV